MKDVQRAVWLFFMSVCLGYALTACASFVPTEKPATLEERIAVESLRLSGFRNTHADLIESGRVTPSIDKDLVDLEKSMQDAIDAARAAVKIGDLSSAEGQMQALKAVSDALKLRIAQLEGKQ